MPHFLFPLLLLAHLTAIYASSELTSSGEMDLNSILIQPDDANQFLSASGERRRLEVCAQGTWYEYGFFDDECNDCGPGRYQDQNGHQESNCKGGSIDHPFIYLFNSLLLTTHIFTCTQKSNIKNAWLNVALMFLFLFFLFYKF